MVPTVAVAGSRISIRRRRNYDENENCWKSKSLAQNRNWEIKFWAKNGRIIFSRKKLISFDRKVIKTWGKDHSVNRFREFWQNFRSVWEYSRPAKYLAKKISLLLWHFFAIVQICLVGNGTILKKENLSIWSHWSRWLQNKLTSTSATATVCNLKSRTMYNITS